jgi:serine/threonine-protein kinase RsbW
MRDNTDTHRKAAARDEPCTLVYPTDWEEVPDEASAMNRAAAEQAQHAPDANPDRGAGEWLAGLRCHDEFERRWMGDSLTWSVGTTDRRRNGPLPTAPPRDQGRVTPLPEAGMPPERTASLGGLDDWRCRRLSSPEDVSPAIAAVVAAMAAAGYSERDQFGMRLALEEALVNAIRHGNRGDPNNAVRLRYHVTAWRVLAEVEDEGAGFDLQQVPDPLAPENLDRPSGRGLLLMRSYMTWVRFNARGNRVTLCRRRCTESGESPGHAPR